MDKEVEGDSQAGEKVESEPAFGGYQVGQFESVSRQ
jgi:hypothetical protein